MKKQLFANNAVIDLGTNSIRMLIFRRNKKGQLLNINRSLQYTKLGQNLTKTGVISEDAITRNLEALEDFQKIAKDYDVKHVYIYGTNAMRDAKNSEELVKLIKDRFGLNVDIISGEKEALYEFTGVSLSFHDQVLIFDIGGGSTELISGDKDIEGVKSLPLGCVRCSEDFIKDQNNIKESELKELFDYAYSMIKDTLKDFDLSKEFNVIGTGGTITTLSTINQQLEIYDSSKVHNSYLTFDQIRTILKDLVEASLEDRQKIVGLPSKRIDTIVAGTVVTLAVLKAAKKTRCTISDFDNLEGAAYIKFLKNNPKEWDSQDYKK